MLRFSLLVAAVSAATVSFPNSSSTTPTSEQITSFTAAATSTTGESSWLTSVLCLEGSQDCNRTGYPEYPFLQSEFQNPYAVGSIPAWIQSEEKTSFAQSVTGSQLSLYSYCGGVWSSQFNQWLATAPITSGSIIPAETITRSSGEVISTVTAADLVYSTTFSGMTTETETLEDIPSGAPAESTWTHYAVDPDGVKALTTNYLSFFTATYSDEIKLLTTSYYTITNTALTTLIEPATTHFAQYVSPYFSYQASSPCCMFCTLYGKNVQVYYWPTPAASPPVSTLVNAANFTFISPSVYVAFQSLYATDICGTLGSAISETTLAFSEGELSTDYGYSWNSADYPTRQPYLPPLYTQATFGDHGQECTYITTYFYETYASALPASYLSPDWPSISGESFYRYTVSYNPCSPTLSVPTEIFAINTLYSTCAQGIAGLYDPPYVLSTGNGMSAFFATESSSASSNGPTWSALAGPTISPVTPGMTSIHGPTPAPTPSNGLPVQSPSNSLETGSLDSTSISASSPLTASTIDPPNAFSSPNGNGAITIGSSTITPNAKSGFVLGTQTLTPGGQITHSGTVLSPASNGNTMAIGGTTQSVIYIVPISDYIVESQTLVPGSAITVSGSVISLESGGASVVMGGSTIPISQFLATTPEYVIGSQTLTAGASAITVSGVAVSLGVGGSSVVVGGTTEALSVYLGSTTTRAGGGLGSIIATIGGFATDPAPSSKSSLLGNGTVPFAGAAVRNKVTDSFYMMGIVLGGAIWWVTQS